MNAVVDKDALYLKFPAVLREKLKNGDIVFPQGTQYHYIPVKAYRGVKRETDDYSDVSRDDFKSYAEIGRKKVRGQRINPNTAEYYGVSLFRKRGIVENVLNFPNTHKKIVMGYVLQEGGPQLTNEETEHVCWWLYLNADLSGFEIV